MSRIARAALLFTLIATAAGASAAPFAIAPASAPHVETARPAAAASLRAELLARRRHLLAVLHAYRVAGVFPINTSAPGQGHFLIDPYGHYCAVANLIVQDGHQELVLAASRSNNALLFGDVKEGPLHDWILTSGFTQEEIARIQVPAPYVPPQPDPQLVERANAQVSAYLTKIERTLRAQEKSGLELAVARLARRPDLAAGLAPRA